MGIRRITSDQRLAPILGVGIALIAGTTLVAYAVVGRQVGSSLRDSRSVLSTTQRVTVVASRDPRPIVLPAPEVETPAQKPQPVTTETVELVAQAPSTTETSTEPETFSGGISGEVNPGLTDRIVGSIGEFVRRGVIGPSEGPDAPWGAAPPDGPGSHTGGIEGDAIGGESDEQGSPPAEDAEAQEWDWNEPGDNYGNGSDSDDSGESGSEVPGDQGGSNAPDDDGPSDDQTSDEAKEDDDDYDWPDGDDGDGKGPDDDGNDNDSDDSGSSSASSGSG